MAVWNNFPYVDTHELNLDWIIKEMNDLIDEWKRVNSGVTADAVKSDEAGAYVTGTIADGLHFHFELPKGDKGDTGEQGPQGPSGNDFTIKALVASTSDLPATGQPGDAYAVGTAASNTVYIWDTLVNDWVDVGPIVGPEGPQGEQGEQGEQGPRGYYFTPSVNSAGVISWSNNGGLPNPTSRNIMGPTGPQGPQGPQGVAGRVSDVRYSTRSLVEGSVAYLDDVHADWSVQLEGLPGAILNKPFYVVDNNEYYVDNALITQSTYYPNVQKYVWTIATEPLSVQTQEPEIYMLLGTSELTLENDGSGFEYDDGTIKAEFFSSQDEQDYYNRLRITSTGNLDNTRVSLYFKGTDTPVYTEEFRKCVEAVVNNM